MSLSADVAKLEQDLQKARANAAYWKMRCSWLLRVCESNKVDVKALLSADEKMFERLENYD